MLTDILLDCTWAHDSVRARVLMPNFARALQLDFPPSMSNQRAGCQALLLCSFGP
jgi:hypothetical protein